MRKAPKGKTRNSKVDGEPKTIDCQFALQTKVLGNRLIIDFLSFDYLKSEDSNEV